MKRYKIFSYATCVLFAITVNAQTNEAPEPAAGGPKIQSGSEEINRVKTRLSELSKSKILFYRKPPDDPVSYDYKGEVKNILVFDDRMEFLIKEGNEILNFSDLVDYDINPTGTQLFGGNIYIDFKQKGASEKLAKDLILIQNLLKVNRNSQLVLFEPIAAQYRALKIKPAISEELRKYIVQANALNQKKEYQKAIELYNKAVELDNTAYPAAYSNLALLSAQIQRFEAAIYNMKKYLMLEPEASDARSAKDKIYEWELMIAK